METPLFSSIVERIVIARNPILKNSGTSNNGVSRQKDSHFDKELQRNQT